MPRLLLQTLLILLVCRLAGRFLRRFGQPSVVAEMLAGILVGPSLLGALFPGFHAALFPASSLPALHAFAHGALLLYMFLVGLELDAGHLRARWRTGAAVSLAGIAVPFLLGAGLAVGFHNDPALFPPELGWPRAALFLGATMSVTAFPVLARILQQMGMLGSRVGALALAAGSLDDAAAWTVLSGLAGLVPAFAAFLAGALVPRAWAGPPLRRLLKPATAWLLPVFFAYSGLHTRIGLLAGPRLLLTAVLVLAAATAGKGGACYAAARLVGEPPREALAIGALMNARGLMELIILNIGLERGLIQPALFTILVLMAVLTTLMATPVFQWTYRRHSPPQPSSRVRVEGALPAASL